MCLGPRGGPVTPLRRAPAEALREGDALVSVEEPLFTSHVQITKGKFGNAKYVSWGKRVAWKKKERLDCTVAVVRKGVIKFPAKKEG